MPEAFSAATRGSADGDVASREAAHAMDRKIVRSPHSQLWRRFPVLAGILVIIAAIAAIRFVPSSGTLRVQADEITTGAVSYGPFLDYLPMRAVVAPLRTVYLGAIEGGTVEQVPMLDGNLVKAGDVLAHLANPQLQLDVSSREAAIASQLSEVSAQRLSLQQTMAAENNTIAEARYNLLKAKRELNIRERLHEQGFESDAGVKSFADEASYYDSRVATLLAARVRDQAVAQHQMEEIDRTAAGLHTNLHQVESSLDALILNAPIAGRLTSFALQPGQTIKQGDAIGQIDSEGEWRLNADVDEFYLGRITEGEHAIADLNGHATPLVVSRVRPQVTNGQFRVELTFSSSAIAPMPADVPPLRRGQSVEIKVTLGDTHQALIVQNGPWLESGGGNTVFVLDPGGNTARRRSISVGRRNPEQVEVVSGLKSAERIIVSSYTSYRNYDHIDMR